MSAEPKSTLVATWLPPDGYDLLKDDFTEWGVPLPDPSLSSVAIVIDTETNELAGFIAAQTVVHLEPLKVREGYREGEVLKLLINKIQEPFKESGGGFYCFVPNARIESLVKREGMEILDWKIARKSFEKEDA